MGFRRGLPPVAASLGLMICGVAGAVAWRNGLWGLLTGAMVAALWLAALNTWAAVRPRAVTPPVAVTRADADARAVRLLLDAAPTPLVGIEGTTARSLNRAARRLFATDDRILPPPAALTDPAATRLHHEGRGWRIDRVLVTDGRSVAALIDIEQEERVAEARASADMIQVLELPPCEWSIDYDSLDQGRDDECLPRSTSPRKSSGSCARLRSCWVRAARPPRPAGGSPSASRLTIGGARNMAA